MRRPARLADARVWLPTYGGQNIVRGYARWYGVDLGCAIKELRLLGVKVSEDYAVQVERSLEQCMLARERKRGAVPVAPSAEECRVGWLGEWSEHLEYGADTFESWADEVPVAVPEVWLSEEPDLRCEDEEPFIEHAFLGDVFALDLKVIEVTETPIVPVEETTLDCVLFEDGRSDASQMRVQIVLEEDPDVLAARAWSLIYVLGVLSYADAQPRVDNSDGGSAWAADEWTVDDMLRRLAFDRGRLSFHAGRVRGRHMGTTVEIDPDGKITLETVGRGHVAKRWISKLRGKRWTSPTPDPDGDWPDSCPF